MNDGNIRYYLETELAELNAKIQGCNDDVETYNQNIDDTLKRLRNYKAHYTSLLNTAIAYGSENLEDEQDE